MITIAILGGGFMGASHAASYRALGDRVNVKTVASHRSDRAAAVADSVGAELTDDLQSAVRDPEVDVVDICLPTPLHRELAEEAFAAGKHVLLEKPIALTLEDADAIVAAADVSSAICAVGYQYHASELLDDARTLLDGQQVGLLISRNFGPVAGRPWFMDRAQGGGQILERASHHIDLQQALAGPIASVQATGGGVDLSQTDAPNGIEDAIALVFQFANGAIGSVHSAWTRAGQPELYGIDVVASDATLALQLGPKAFRLTGRSGGADVAREHGEPMDRSIARFVDAVRAGDQSLVACRPAEARDTLAVALACERALESGGHVAVTR